MQIERMLMTIESISGSCIGCHARNSLQEIRFNYYPGPVKLDFNNSSLLADIICRYKFQFEKIIKSTLNKKITVGRKINCVFIEDFKFLTEEDYSRYIRMDRRNGRLEISICGEETERINRISVTGWHRNLLGFNNL